jgi:hypothetical protein
VEVLHPVIRLLHFSRLGIVVVATFILLLLSFRLTLPFGDEPDFTVRAAELTEIEWPAWTLYSWVPGLLKSLKTTSECVIGASPMSLVAHIDHASCSENLVQVLLRCILTLLVLFPLLLLIVWRGLGMLILKKTIDSSAMELRARLDAVALSLLIPGMIYYLSLLSHEQFTLVISLFIFLFWSNWTVVLILLSLVAFIDMGNAVVIACFIVVQYISRISINRLGLKFTLIIGIFILLLINFIENELISLAGMISLLEDRSNAISVAATTIYEDLRDKFPIVLRPVITFMTFFFSTPSGIKVVPIYFIACLFIFIAILRLRVLYSVSKNSNKDIDAYWLGLVVSGIYTIILLIFILPGYANGKYYVFLLPFMTKLVMEIFSTWTIYRFLACISLLVPISLILFRL